ncbi:MAG TPA: Rrf2 family transcriptional regulator [Coriobacteriia bacterium]|nr:Rrf2 family transcriptional regulator [Coriobacteriia bacterium]
MDISRRTDYAIRLLTELARQPQGVAVSVRQLAEEGAVPYAFARGIQRDLSAAGLITATRGAHGGISLSREPRSITLLEVVEALQGDVSCSVCTKDPEWCKRMGGCRVHRVWREMDAMVRKYLAEQDLAGLAKSI